MNVEINVIHQRCWKCRRWYGTEVPCSPCGACAMSDISELNAIIRKLRRSNAALRGALKRRKK